MASCLSISTIYFLVLVCLFILSYGLGNLVLKFCTRNYRSESFYLHTFFSLLIGASIIVIVGSLICTRGVTVNFAFVIIAFLLLLEFHFFKGNTTGIVSVTRPQLNYKNVLSVLFVVLIVFAWHASTVLKFGSFPVDQIENDNLYYADISKCLVTTGQENSFTTSNLVNQNYNFPTPYHYFDLWLNGFIGKVFHLNYCLSLYLIVYSFFTTIFVIGLLGCVEFFEPKKGKIKHLAVFLIFVSGLYISEKIFRLTNYSAQMEGAAEHFGEKLLPVYCFALCVIILFVIKKNIKAALLVLLCLPVIFISIAPAVYAGLALFCIFKALFKGPERSFYLRTIVYVLIVSASIGLFYHLTKKNNLNFRFDKPLLIYTDLTSFSFFRIKFYLVELFLKTYAQPFLFFINYFPFALLFIYLFIVKAVDPYFRSLAALFGFILFCGLIAFNTVYLMDDAHQLYINTIALWHVLFAFSFIYFQNKLKERKNLTKTIISSVFILALIFNAVNSWYSYKKVHLYNLKLSEKYILAVNNECDKFSEDTRGATFYNESFFKKILSTYPNERYCTPFILNQNSYTPFDLTDVAQVPKENKFQIEKVVSKSPFNLYLKEQLNSGNVKDVLEHQLDFIKKNKIRFLICSKEQTTDFAKYLSVKTEITDDLSGQRFIVLN